MAAAATGVPPAGLAALALGIGVAAAWFVWGRRAARQARRLQGVARALGESPAANDELARIAGELRARVDALEHERADREAILAHMSDGVALVDAQGRIARTNHQLATLLDAPRPAAPGTPFHEFVRVPDLDALIQQARRESRTVERDLRLWTPSGRHVHATARPLGGPAPAAVLLVVHDLTEAERVERIRQDFVANVSHELRTPLTSLRGYAETLLEGGLEDAQHREHFVRVMRDQAVRLQALVEDLLSLAELERPDAALRLETFDLRELADQQVASQRELAARGGLGLELAPGPAVIVSADRVRIAQALANLLDNALKYAERGRVQVCVGEQGAIAWFEVADEGPGIPLEDQPRLFERFYRVDKARSREKGGTGLGLSIVKHAAQLHDGDVRVESVPGRGATFRVEIPNQPLDRRTAARG